MTALFKTPKMPTPQQVAPKVTEAQERQEDRIEAQEEMQKRQMAARRRARRTGGSRQLLSSVRGGTADEQTTLGV